MKKGLDLGGMIDTANTPKDTGIPQRGAIQRKPREERRSDQMSIRMKPSTRQLIEDLAAAEDVPIAEIIEQAINAYRPK
jgi:predicted HicB family RNase H-like nuclease